MKGNQNLKRMGRGSFSPGSISLPLSDQSHNQTHWGRKEKLAMISHRLNRLQTRVIAIAAAAVLMAFGTATPVFAQQTREFEAEMHHFSAPQGPCVNGVCNYVTCGVGFTNLMGPVTVTVVFTWDFNTTPCSTLDPMVWTLVGTTGSITISASGVFCEPRGLDTFPQYFSAVGVVTGGTGEFSGITGSVTIQGPAGGRGPVVHMSGTVSY
jgi:hypothetical protein